MEEEYPWSSGYIKESRCLGLHLSIGVLILGILGVTIGIGALVAYAVCQVPTIRAAFGNYFYNTTLEEVDHFERIEYTIEISVCSISGILGILVNAMLIIGVIKTKRWYMMHWLIFHVFVVISGLIAAILVAILQTDLYKLFCLIPFVLTFLITFCWIKVYQLFCEMGVEVSPPLPCIEHPYGPPNTYLASDWAKLEGEDQAGPSAANSGHWQAHKNVLEFYPIDHISRKMQERLQERPFWRSNWSVDLDRNSYKEFSDGEGSSVNPTTQNNITENTYATLPEVQTSITSRDGFVNDGFEGERRSADPPTLQPQVSAGQIPCGEIHHHTGDPCPIHKGLFHRLSQESRTDSNVTQLEI